MAQGTIEVEKQSKSGQRLPTKATETAQKDIESRKISTGLHTRTKPRHEPQDCNLSQNYLDVLRQTPSQSFGGSFSRKKTERSR